MLKRTLQIVALVALVSVAAFAHVGNHPSVHDTVASILERFKDTLSHDELIALTPEKALELLTPDEKEALASEHITFRVNTPVVVSIMRDVRTGDEPFWLAERGFEKTALVVETPGRKYDVWQRAFEAGEIGLGVNSISGGGDHYFVALKPQDGSTKIEITDMYPGQHTVDVLRKGVTIYSDRDNTVSALPAELEGQVLIRGAAERRKDAQLTNVFRMSLYPAGAKPDHVILTWSDDPKTTQAIQWRTDEMVKSGAVVYQKKSAYENFQPKSAKRIEAETAAIETPTILNSPVMNRHTAVITGLEPGTAYIYAVADGDGWLEPGEFTTAPAGKERFSFIYMGDAQNGLESWGSLIHRAYVERPDVAFYIMAGDLVNRGGERDDWDLLFENAKGVYDHRQLVPVLGNHEYQGGEPNLYLSFFKLPTNGPSTIAPEKAYSFTYNNALFVVLDSNQPVETQTAWLDEQLAKSDATWKFVTYHHPAYSSGPNRDNPDVRNVWGAVFDKYHVDMALQGHDHAYLRTYPMKGGQRAASAAEGTIYIVSVSGTKFYEQGEFDYTEFGMTNVATFQVLDIQIEGDRLYYKSYDVDGKLRDEFVIQK